MATLVVTNTLDSGPGSLRGEIAQSNATGPGPNTIDFDIPMSDPGYDSSSGVWTISLLSALPSISVPVTIDGTSQTGYSTTPVIDLDGTSAGAGADGLSLAAGSAGSQVLGLMIENFANAGIDVASANNTIGGAAAGVSNLISGNSNYGVLIETASATGNLVAGNYIGTDVTGTAALGNGLDGVLIDASASDNTIGGTTAAARNVISANAYSGVEIDDANDNVVEGDFIGTDVTGTVALGNNVIGKADGLGEFAGGVFLGNDASGNTIGGLTATPGTSAGNLISGNTYAGVSMYNAGPNNLVAGNLIGTNVTGSVALGNDSNYGNPSGGFGVTVQYSPDTTVGEPGGGNVIAGNGLGTVNGANVNLSYSTGSAVQSNIIGTDITGTVALSTTTYYGVVLQFGSYVVGGLTPTPGTGPGNVISGNGVAGISVANYTAGSTTVIEGNIIGADATGEHAVPNRNWGVTLGDVSLVTVGGTAAGAGNLISGNSVIGVYIDLSSTTANLVAGNLIGTDITGMLAIANREGVVISDGASNNTIGGRTTTPGTGAGNVISGNTDDGVLFTLQNTDSGPTDNLVAGNLIGTNGAGTASLGNGDDGVLIEAGATNNTIGGVTSTPGTGLGNVISGNTNDGAEITGSGTSENVVAGNIIGLNASGNSALGNAGSGVQIDTSASGNTIGGPTASARNVISANLNGLEIIGGASGNTVQSDYIGTDLTGMVAIGNLIDGLYSQGTSDIIGGATNDGQGNPSPGTAPGNVISGNGSAQEPRNTEYNLILGTSEVAAGNLIGLNATGTASLNTGGEACVGLNGGDDTVGGLSPNDRNVITGDFYEMGISGSGDQILNNYFGTDITGTIGLDHIGQSLSAGWNAILILDGANIVFGAPGAGNLVVDSFPSTYYNAFAIFAEESSGLVIQGNKIGTNAAGTAAIPNAGGIYVAGCDGFLIGGTSPGDGNLISGSVLSAITVVTTTGGTIEGNKIGTDVTGTLAIPNDTYYYFANPAAVILANGASDITIGGTTAAARNIISGNDGDGILVSAGYLFVGGNRPSNDGVNQDNTVEGNYIGIKADGSGALPNAGTGIYVAGSALNTTIGGTAAGAANVISGNAGNGVLIDGTGPPSVTPLYLKADGDATNTNVAISGDTVGNGSIVGGVTYGTGITGEAFEFHDTPGERVVVPGGTAYLDQTGLTLSAWINLNSLPGATPYVIASQAYSSTSETYGLYVNSGGQLVF
ncbi:MAG: beta strand repeat-containing protein, partial [Isosphaeraceae bacterium]